MLGNYSISPQMCIMNKYNCFCCVEIILMNKKFEDYGVSAVNRPKVKATKVLDLSGDAGKQIVRSETKLALRTHSKTFEKLAYM